MKETNTQKAERIARAYYKMAELHKKWNPSGCPLISLEDYARNEYFTTPQLMKKIRGNFWAFRAAELLAA